MRGLLSEDSAIVGSSLLGRLLSEDETIVGLSKTTFYVCRPRAPSRRTRRMLMWHTLPAPQSIVAGSGLVLLLCCGVCCYRCFKRGEAVLQQRDRLVHPVTHGPGPAAGALLSTPP